MKIDLSTCINLTDSFYSHYSPSQRRLKARKGYHEYYLPSNGELSFVSPDEKKIQLFSAFSKEDVAPFSIAYSEIAPVESWKGLPTSVVTVCSITQDVLSYAGHHYKTLRRYRSKYIPELEVQPLSAINILEVTDLIKDWQKMKHKLDITTSSDRRMLHNVNNYPDLHCNLYYYKGKLCAFAEYSDPFDVGLDLPIAPIFYGKTSSDAPYYFSTVIDSLIVDDIYKTSGGPFYLDYGSSDTQSLHDYKTSIFPVAFEYLISSGKFIPSK